MLERGGKIIAAIVGLGGIGGSIVAIGVTLGDGRWAHAMDLRITQQDVKVLQVQQADLHDFMDRQDKRSERMESKLDKAIELILKR